MLKFPLAKDSPVERPLEEELASCLGEVCTALVRLEDLVDDTLQPDSPLLEGVLGLQGLLEVLLQLLDRAVLALTHPAGLLLATQQQHRCYLH